MAFSGIQNNGQELTGGNCFFSYDPMNSGSYNTAGLPATSNTPQGVSINFNGSNQYLTYNPTYLSGTTSSLTFGTSDYTWQTSIFVTSLPGSLQVLFDARGSGATGAGLWVGLNTTGTIQAGIAAATQWTSTSSITVNTWNTIAIVRSSGSTTFYINGVSAGVNPDANNYSYVPTLAYIGSVFGGGSYFNGQLTNLRITNGTAVYTANYTPSNQPLNPGGSSLCLLAGSSGTFLFDSSPNNYTMNNNGSMTYATNTAFQTTPGSFYFDGGTYLYANSAAVGSNLNFGNNPFTVEYWLYTTANATGSAQDVVDMRGGSSNAYADFLNTSGIITVLYGTANAATTVMTSNVVVNNNAWNHVAWGRANSSGNLNLWINGVLANTTSTAISQTGAVLAVGGSSPAIGSGFNVKGYVSQLRISNTQVYTSNNFGAPAYLGTTSNTVTLLNTYTASTVKLDSSVNNIQFTTSGNATFGGANYGPYANTIGDLSGRVNTGLLSYAANTTAPIWYSNKNGYWNLTGGSTNKQQIITSVPSPAPGSIGNASTVGAWIQTQPGITAGTQGYPIASFIDTKTGNSAGNWGPLLFINSGNGISYAQYDSGGGSGKAASGSGNVADGNWHYVVGTIQPGSNISVYLDGTLASSTPFTSTGYSSGWWRFGGNPENVGGSPWGTGNVGGPNVYSPLNIGPVHSYNSVLTANQIAQNYNMVKGRYTGGNVTGSQTFTATGSVQTFTVPAGVSLINATVVGAGGGAGGNGVGGGNGQTSFGGYAASITGQLQVSPGQNLYIVAGVGGTNKGGTQGASASMAAGGGGAGGSVGYSANTFGGSGGGFSGIFVSNSISQLSALVIAGGGGGGCGENSGNRTLQAGQGGNAASTLTNTAQAGFNHDGTTPGGLDWYGPYLANISGNGTVVTCRFSTVYGATNGTGNTQSGGQNFTTFFQGQPISVTGVLTTTAYNGGWNVLSANAQGLTFYSTVTGTATNVNTTGNLNGAQVRNFYAQGGGPAQYGQAGYMGFNFDQNATSFAANNGGALTGGWGGYNQGTSWNGGGGGAGGYWGGAGGAQGGSASGAGGGGSNYAAPSVLNASVIGLVAGSTSITGSVGGKVILNW